MNDAASPLKQEISQRRRSRSRSQEAVVALLQTADAVRHHLASVIEPYGVTVQQYNVLRILRGAHPDPLLTKEVSERLIERTPGITRFLDRLEGLELVRRERCAVDRRQVHCWITPAGLKLLDSMDAAVDRADDDTIRGLAAAETQQLLGLLQQVREGLSG